MSKNNKILSDADLQNIVDEFCNGIYSDVDCDSGDPFRHPEWDLS